jgi:hypothetical protein
MARSQRLIPLKVMARRLGVRPDWLRTEAESGRLPGVLAGHTVLFEPASVERLLLERARAAAREAAHAP